MSLFYLKKDLGQVLTPTCVADLLTSEINLLQDRFNFVADLGGGTGILTKSILAKNFGKNHDIFEIDSDLVEILKNDKVLSQTNIYNKDVFHINLSKYDLVVSNPPFIQFQKNEKIREYGDILFLEKMWSEIKEGSIFSFIVTNTFISNSKYRNIRSKILSETSEFSVIELDVFSYHKAEVQSFIITGKRGKVFNNKIILKKSNIFGEIVDELELMRKDALIRMDISFYKAINQLNSKLNLDGPLLGDLISNIARGSKSHAYFKKKSINVFHTTDFSKYENNIFFEKNNIENEYKKAYQGDILIPRVGTRCLNYSAYVEGGNSIFTDCIYRIRSEKKYQDLLMRSISSPEGVLWRKISATGSCAKHLTLDTLKKMPLFF